MKKFSFFSSIAKLIPISLLLLALSLSAWGLYMAEKWDSTPENAKNLVELLIVPGQNASDVASEFERLGIVTSAGEFSKWMVSLGIDRRIKPGIYRIHSGRPRDVAREFAEASPEILEVRILPGVLLEEVASSLGRNDAEKLLLKALSNGENFPARIRPLLPEKTSERMLLLAPETYSISPGDGCAEELVRMAAAIWSGQHADDIPKDFKGREIADAGILASIVQKEALVDSDRPLIAGVFKNRLDIDMPLQSCATVAHAWRLRGVKITNVSLDDVKIDSPFNTYLHKGLPPESIGLPSANSWGAVLKPASTDMLFFVAKTDGSHVFTRTYKEHLAAQKKIRKGEL
ncbi:MAG: endolytic transglycosylase MltG [Synergistaceae bacterium]|nr:endolytic transglycosylase MltG [Synergistaceae bacterium]